MNEQKITSTEACPENIIINYKDNLLYSNLIYNDPVKQRNGHYSKVLYKDGCNMNKIVISTPYLKMCRNLFFRENNCYIEVELGRQDKDFFIFLNQLEENNLKIIFEKSEKWFGSFIPMDILEEYQQQLIRINNNGCPKMKIYVPIVDNHPIVNNLEEGERVSLLIEFEGIRFLKQQFISVWNLRKIKNETTEYEFGDNYLFDDSDILSSYKDIDINISGSSYFEKDNSNLDNTECRIC